MTNATGEAGIKPAPEGFGADTAYLIRELDLARVSAATWNGELGSGATVISVSQARELTSVAVKLELSLAALRDLLRDLVPASQLQHGDDIALTFTHSQIDEWAGRHLSDDELEALEAALPNSTLPDAVYAIADSLSGPDGR